MLIYIPIILILCFFIFINSYQIIIYLIILIILLLLKGLVNNAELTINFLYFDLISFRIISLTVWITFLILIARRLNNLFQNKIFTFYILIIINLLFFCFSINNFIIFYLFFESVLFPIILIIIGWGSQPERVQAGFYILMYTIFGSLPLLVLILMKRISFIIIYNDWLFGEIKWLFILIILGFLVKIPIFLFHLWLPKAHVEAPISGSIILAGVLLKLGFYGLYRFKRFFFIDLINYRIIIIVISLWGAVIIRIYCLFQIDIKSLIAYSSVSHMGVALRGCLTFYLHGSYGILIIIIGHGLCSSGLFCLSNLIYERFYTRNIFIIKGINLIFPNLTLWWFLFRIVNISAPLTINLFRELFLGLRVIKFRILLIIPIIILIFLRACYSIFIYRYINHGQRWIIFRKNIIFAREYYLLFLHFIPLILWFIKFNFFIKWL